MPSAFYLKYAGAGGNEACDRSVYPVIVGDEVPCPLVCPMKNAGYIETHEGDENADHEELTRQALRLAKGVADEFGVLMAGNISNTNTWIHSPNEQVVKLVRNMFEEQVRWAQEEGADFIIAETFSHLNEALLAVEVIKAAGISRESSSV